jgi:hypothetical protein
MSRTATIFEEAAVKLVIATSFALIIALAGAAQTTPQRPESTRAAVPTIPYDSQIDFLKNSPDMNFGEVLGIAVNSKGHVVVLNHPGSAAAGPLYGNASTQLLEFDQTATATRTRESPSTTNAAPG